MTHSTIQTLNEKSGWYKKNLGPLSLILLCPPAVILFWYTNTVLGGSFLKLWEQLSTQPINELIAKIWGPIFWGSPKAWGIIAAFAFFELALMKLLPGKTYHGPVTPKGNVPVYKANGVSAYLVTLAAFCLASFQFGLFSPTIIYDNFAEILSALNIFSLVFCLFLLIKGYLFPSSSDCGTSGNLIFDYYWGTELYPRILGWDVKMFTNCRFGMMGWALIIISFAAKQHELYGLSDSMFVAVALQLLYISKFFLWETGYLSSLDIMHDRAGFYICWGCLVWVPGIYTSASLYLVNHPNHLGPLLSFLILALGGASILINYYADRQRQRARITGGNCKIWRREPVITRAVYRTEQGEVKENILLCSGWWGISRHFHYVPEILGAFFWTLPALFSNFLPWFYVIFLVILLTHRAFRDDERCAEKYGSYWAQYCQLVPYKIIPYIV